MARTSSTKVAPHNGTFTFRVDEELKAALAEVAATRALVVVGMPAVVVHRIEQTVVLVLRSRHGAQRWPPS